MEITIDPSSGFCFGVVYAIEMAEEMLDQYGKLYCLGDIVHNDAEVQRLRARGLVSITHEELQHLRDTFVLIRAHGEPPATYELALRNNIILIDATCPVVLKLQNRVKVSYTKEERIFIMGDPNHAEVIGLRGQIGGDAVVFMHPDEIDAMEKLPARVTLYSQTTKSRKKLRESALRLQKRGVEVTFHDTICSQVSNRDEELRAFSGQFDAIVFVSGKKSSNGKVLYQVCKETNPNSYLVSEPSELQPEWFEGKGRVGICGATSTPLWLMEAVRDSIHRMACLSKAG